MHTFTRLVHKGVALAFFGSLFTATSAARADTLYVANISSSSVEQYSSGGTRSVFNNTSLNQPVGLAFDNAGHLFVSNFGGNYIEELDSSGAHVRSISVAAGSGPTGLAFDSAGNLYVAQTNADRIDKITLGAIPTVSTFINGSSDGFLVSPLGLAFDAAGNLYIADSGANHIERITPSVAPSIFAQDSAPNDPLNSPFGLAFDAAGTLFVTSAGNNSIEKINTFGIMSVFANSSVGLDVPTGIAFDSAGNLFVANAGQNLLNTIQEFAVGSSTPTTFATVTDSDHRRLIAFAPQASLEAAGAPLPSAASAGILLLAGLGALHLRRRFA